MKKYLTLITTVGLLAGFGHAQAATAWASVGAHTNTQTWGLDVAAGVAILPIPLVGLLGVEAGADGSYVNNVASVNTPFVGATLRDISIPFTEVSFFAGTGLRFVNSGVSPYINGGMRTPFFGPIGLRVLGQLNSGNASAAEIRFGIAAELAL